MEGCVVVGGLYNAPPRDVDGVGRHRGVCPLPLWRGWLPWGDLLPPSMGAFAPSPLQCGGVGRDRGFCLSPLSLWNTGVGRRLGFTQPHCGMVGLVVVGVICPSQWTGVGGLHRVTCPQMVECIGGL